jgi:hypothetical protein
VHRPHFSICPRPSPMRDISESVTRFRSIDVTTLAVVGTA